MFVLFHPLTLDHFMVFMNKMVTNTTKNEYSCITEKEVNREVPNSFFEPNRPCVVLPLADLNLPLSEANLHLPHVHHVGGANGQTAVMCNMSVTVMSIAGCGTEGIVSESMLLQHFIR